jgi:hypothetical protein
MLAWSEEERPSERHVVDHINRNRADNRLENLRWATPEENAGNWDRPKEHAGFPVHKYELDGTFIETLEKTGQSVSAFLCAGDARLHCDGFLWSHAKPLPSHSYRAVLARFPDFCPDKHKGIDWDTLRPFIIAGTDPLTQFAFDGKPLHVFKSVKEAAKALEVTEAAINQRQDMLAVWGMLRKSTIEEALGRRTVREDHLELVHQALQKGVLHSDTRVQFDWEFVERYVKSGFDGASHHKPPKPVWQLDLDGKRIYRWRSTRAAEIALGLGKTVVDTAARTRAKKKVYRTTRENGEKNLWEWADFGVNREA